jgi:hypothetical protein
VALEDEMKYFQINVKWTSGFEHCYFIQGSHKQKELEEDRLSQFNYITDFAITEINENQFNELADNQ